MNRLLKNFLVFGLLVSALFNTQCVNTQLTPTQSETSSISLKGTDIYNGLRGQSFNENWKFYQGVDNGNSPTSEPYKANKRKAFSGKCLVIVQTTKTPGSIVLIADSKGLSSTSVTIHSISEKPARTFYNISD